MAESGTVAVKEDLGTLDVQSIAVLELYRAQYETAHFLELAYLGVAEQPDLAGKIRLTAHQARTQHSMTVGLMKNFKATGLQILNAMIPMIRDAVELQDKELVEDCFKQVIEWASDMKNEAVEMKESYYKIQGKVQEDITSVQQKNEHIVNEKARIQIEMETEQKKKKELEAREKQYESEEQQMNEEIEALKENKDIWMSKVNKDNEEGDRTFLDAATGPQAGGIGALGAKAFAVDTAIKVVGGLFQTFMRDKRTKEAMDMVRDTQKNISEASAKRREATERKHTMRSEQLERLETIEKLKLNKDKLGDETSLMEAAAKLGEVDRQFNRIIKFWENMVVALKVLQRDTVKGGVYLKKLEDERYSSRFLKSVDNSEKGWKIFSEICSQYVATCESNPQLKVDDLYAFLSGSVDKMSEDQKQARMVEVEANLKNSIMEGTA